MLVGGMNLDHEQLDVEQDLPFALRQTLQMPQPTFSQPIRFLMREDFERTLARTNTGSRRQLMVTCQRSMMQQEGGPGPGLVPKPLRNRFRDPSVQFLAAAAKQGFVGRLLHQNVLESVTCVGWRAGAKYHFRA